MSTLDGLLSRDEARRVVEQARAEGRQVAFANGCFDLLHVGHLRFLKASRAEADLLIVGLNDDASVRGLKGAGRPLVPALERAEMLLGFAAVDHVVLFSEPSPADLIADLRPDVHCKGTDYGSPEQVPEYATVQAYGGRTALVGDPKDHGTTDLIAAVRALEPPAPGS
ncbi:MAG: adenylyltransferase/cytidyltransferase family protein [Acidobacteriota bacterium]